jgi:hypothetical protein
MIRCDLSAHPPDSRRRHASAAQISQGGLIPGDD